MAKATVYSIVLAPELRDAFLAAAAACERPPAQVLRGLMREFIQRQQDAGADDAGDSSTEVSESAATENITDVTAASDIAELPATAADASAAPAVAAAASDPAAEASPATSNTTEAKAAASEAVA